MSSKSSSAILTKPSIFRAAAFPIAAAKSTASPFTGTRESTAISANFLLQFVDWPEGLLEQSEGLEQLRALENNARIHVVITEDDSPGVDTPEQARIVARQITAG